MKASIITLAIVFVLILSSCGKDEDSDPKPQSDSINKIMPLGASRVEGARPAYESFRYELWKDLTEAGWTFDYVGTQTDDASYPSLNDNNFDVDHEGRGGWTSGQILNEINNWLAQTGPPDIVLFSSPGGNDGLENLPYDEAISNINAIIDALQASNPNVTIVIEQMAPGRSDIMTAELTNYLSSLQQDVAAIASEQTTATSSVIAVDMYTDFNDNLLADEVHYNQSGAQFVADRYYAVLATILQE